ncbi:hypothetical protein HHI36_012527 [Cryptolaemus montrouzieri]|uniref:Uncharacterized protein n=1 Tax=Cryptolaemus montrouzieri TaxID=559131 RepID=A0ABD2NEI5_9CUCU
MGESCKKRQWLDCPYVNPDVYQLSQIISLKPTEESLESLLTYLKDDSNLLRRNDARSLFLYYLAKCNTNKSLKNEFLNKVTNSKADFSLFTTIIVESVKDVLFDFEIEQTLLSSRNIVFLLPVVNTFYQMCLEKDNEKVGAVLDSILPLYDVIFDTFVQQLRVDFEETYNFKNEELLSLANHTMKQVLWVFVKRPNSNVDSYVLAFLDYSYRILSYERIALDMKSKCGLIFVHCLKRLPEEELEEFVFKTYPMLEVTNRPEEKEKWICGKNFKFESLLESNSAKVVLFSALFNCISIDEQLSLKLADEKCVFQTIIEELLGCTDRPMRDNTEIVEITRNLLQISEHLIKVPVSLYNDIFERSSLSSIRFVNILWM